jgi:hypothetical protein
LLLRYLFPFIFIFENNQKREIVAFGAKYKQSLRRRHQKYAPNLGYDKPKNEKDA